MTFKNSNSTKVSHLNSQHFLQHYQDQRENAVAGRSSQNINNNFLCKKPYNLW